MGKSTENKAKAKNKLGILYHKATIAEKTCFRGELLKAQEADSVNYMKRFLDTWQFVPTTGIIPHRIIRAAERCLGFSEELPLSEGAALELLKMV